MTAPNYVGLNIRNKDRKTLSFDKFDVRIKSYCSLIILKFN